MLTAVDDRRLVDRARQGDQDAFAQLVERHTKLVYSLALQKVQNHHDAEEVAQTVFLRAWQALPSFRGDAAFATWLYRLTSNACVDLLRQRQRRGEPLSLQDPHLPQVAGHGPDPAELAHRQEQRAALMDAIDRLPDHARSVLLLREMEGLSYEEIARTLDIQLGTVRSRLARARSSLGKILRKQGNLWEDFSSNPSETKTEACK